MEVTYFFYLIILILGLELISFLFFYQFFFAFKSSFIIFFYQFHLVILNITLNF